MDQRKINLLLVQCANSPLTVEVRQVRVNPDLAGAGTSRSSSSYEGNYSGTGLNFEGSDNLIGTQGTGLPGSGEMDSDFAYDVTVEIYGIIYIYNPVDEAILGGEEDTTAA